MRITITGFFIVLAALLFFSCEKESSRQEIPSYIRIDSVQLEDNININEGTLSHNITDAWVYVNNQLIGTFELPATFPVLAKGEADIMIKAGIKLNGVASTRIPYPFFTEYRANSVTLTPETVTTMQPVVQYNETSSIPWHESFDNDNLRMKQQGDTTLARITGQEAFDASGSGRIVLQDSAMFFEATSDTGYVLPRNGNPVFLEMNFKTNHTLTTGLYADNPATSQQKAIVVLNKTATWKKIYINLTTTVLNTQQATSYRVFLGTVRSPETEKAVIDIDNLKIIHF
jgi:hypothetical protein